TSVTLSTTCTTDCRFQFYRHNESQGLAVSLIELAKQTRGRYLARQDADDWSSPKRLEKQSAFLDAHPAVAAVGCAFQVHDENEIYLDTLRPWTSPRLIRRALRRRNPFAHGSLMFRRDAFLAVGGYRAS